MNGLLTDNAYIDGQWVHADDQRTFPVMDPANGSTIAHVPDMGPHETIRAIRSAKNALKSWKKASPDERARLLRKLNALILQNIDPLATILTQENGKPIAESRGEVRYGASFVEWFSEEARRIYGETIPAARSRRRILVSKEPVGVCALITPWNFPHAMITRKLAPALAAGCTVVIKPAEETPLSALAIAALCHEAGIPPGVVNVVTTRDPAAVGTTLCEATAVRKLSFTGSSEVGRLLMAMCAPSLKKLSLELGGSAPFIVFDDADIEAAVDGAMASKFRNNGQTCIASNRFLVQEGILDAFVQRVAHRAAALTVGHGLDEGTQVGPMISEDGKRKVHRLLQDAVQKGAVLACGGVPDPEAPDLFLKPTVLTGVSPEMDIWAEEIFGPVVAVRTFHDEQEAISLANQTPYGLAAYCYTQNLGRSWRVREALEFGMVGINTGMISTARAPFGGIKQSGIGREGSRYGIEEYLQVKYTCLEV